jgi:hypothetical protein
MSAAILHGFPSPSMTGVCPTCHKIDTFVDFVLDGLRSLPDADLGAHGVCHAHRCYWNAGFKFLRPWRREPEAGMVREWMTLIRAAHDRVEPYYPPAPILPAA